MKKLALALAGGAAFAIAAPAQAATVIDLEDDGSGTLTGEFTGSVRTAGTFSQMFTFFLPENGFTASSITTIAITMAGNIDFTSVTLNGQEFTLSPTGFVENGFIQLFTRAGEQTLIVNGISGTNAGFSGVVTFTPGVPEPGMWLLMILGFGAVGGAMRYRRRQNHKVSTKFSFA